MGNLTLNASSGVSETASSSSSRSVEIDRLEPASVLYGAATVWLRIPLALEAGGQAALPTTLGKVRFGDVTSWWGTFPYDGEEPVSSTDWSTPSNYFINGERDYERDGCLFVACELCSSFLYSAAADRFTIRCFRNSHLDGSGIFGETRIVHARLELLPPPLLPRMQLSARVLPRYIDGLHQQQRWHAVLPAYQPDQRQPARWGNRDTDQAHSPEYPQLSVQISPLGAAGPLITTRIYERGAPIPPPDDDGLLRLPLPHDQLVDGNYAVELVSTYRERRTLWSTTVRVGHVHSSAIVQHIPSLFDLSLDVLLNAMQHQSSSSSTSSSASSSSTSSIDIFATLAKTLNSACCNRLSIVALAQHAVSPPRFLDMFDGSALSCLEVDVARFDVGVLDWAARLPLLTDLTLRCADEQFVAEPDVFAAMPSLTRLHFAACYFSPPARLWAALRRAGGLRELGLTTAFRHGQQYELAVDDDCRAVCNALTRLELCGFASFAAVAELFPSSNERLESLTLSLTALDDAGLVYLLRTLPRLVELAACRTRLSPACLAHLADAPQLRRVRINNCHGFASAADDHRLAALARACTALPDFACFSPSHSTLAMHRYERSVPPPRRAVLCSGGAVWKVALRNDAHGTSVVFVVKRLCPPTSSTDGDWVGLAVVGAPPAKYLAEQPYLPNNNGQQQHNNNEQQQEEDDDEEFRSGAHRGSFRLPGGAGDRYELRLFRSYTVSMVSTHPVPH